VFVFIGFIGFVELTQATNQLNNSAAEVQSEFYVALDQGYVSQDDFDKVYNQAEVVSKLDSGFIKYLQPQK